ncbi:hypothetical protein GALL_223570 [mine drainage metagenome]|uniref:Exo-alpha-sialidase n=1 Tax=mine drainage metagenome TaxID=410659 RepID=A0A1J5RIT7_9ZZZZ
MRPLIRLIALLVIPAAGALLAQERYDLRLTVEATSVPVPMHALASAPELARSPGGELAMAWAERGAQDRLVLRVSEFDPALDRWKPPATVAQGVALEGAPSDALSLAYGARGRLALAWTERDGALRAMMAESTDGGCEWSAPVAVASAQMTGTEWPTVTARPGGGWALAWISDDSASKSRVWLRPDTRGGVAGPVGVPASPLRPMAAAFGDGSSLVVFRGLTPAGARDPVGIRFEDNGVRETSEISPDGWVAPAATVPPVRLARSGPLAALAWFTAAGDDPRILTSTTPDGGLRWTAAQRCDLGRVAGPVDVAILSDGTQLVLWVEKPGDDPSLPGGYYLRRYASNGATSMPARLAPLPSRGAPGPVRLAVLREGDGVRTELLAAWVQDGRLYCQRLRLPGAEQLGLLDATCQCGPASVPGYAIRGRILKVDAGASSATIQHSPVPGLFRAGDLAVTLESGLARNLAPGREFLGRIERHGGVWRLSDVRLFD